MARHAASLRIEGRVQGVGYRWWAVQTARRLRLAGWVRNRADGSVEILAIGETDAIGQLADVCGGGPAGAAVVSVNLVAAEDDGSAGFEQRVTL
jgi:acylphosphatase